MSDIALTNYLPPVLGVTPGVSKGRVVREGYQRGWGLQYGGVRAKVLADPIYIRAVACAEGRLQNFSEDNRMNLYLILRFFLSKIAHGHILEFGSFRGGSVLFMGSICSELYPDVRIYALDTYAGMPETDKRVDAHNAGDFKNTSVEDVAAAVAASGLTNIRLVKGLFEDTTPAVLAEAGSVALAHIDCDINSGCRYAEAAVRPHMVQGGYLVFDDATISSCIGATEAVEDMIQRDHVFSEQIWPHFVFRHGLVDVAVG